MTRRFLVVIAFLAISINAQQRPANAPRGGPYSGHEGGTVPVGSIPDITLHDDARNKDVVLTIEYPIRTGSNPLLLFSHGFGGSNRSYEGLSSYWASNGYVVIRPAHKDAASMESQGADDWRNRVRDLTLILDSLDKLEKDFPELQGKIDRAKIGVGGHSYGAFTAMLLGGLKTFPGGTSYADPRVKAILAISPQGPAERFGITNESFSTLKLPVFYLTGTEDKGIAESETPEWRQEAFKLSPDGDKWMIVIEGARHASFTGRMDELIEAIARGFDTADPLGRTSTIGESRMGGRNSRAENAAMRQQEIFGIARGSALAFWDAYLKGEAKGREALVKQKERKGVVEEAK